MAWPACCPSTSARPQQIAVRRGRPLYQRDRQGARRRAASAWPASTSRATTRPTAASTAGRTRPSTPTPSEDIAWWAARARPRPAARHVRREPDDRGRRRQRRGDRRALADRRRRARGLPAAAAVRQARRSRSATCKMVKRFAEAQPARRLPADRHARASCGAGDEIEVVARPEHGVTIRQVSDAILLDDALLGPASRRARAADGPRRLDGRARRLKVRTLTRASSTGRCSPAAPARARRLPLPEALERIGGIQAQYAPSMYIGLWSRVAGFAARRPDPRAGGPRGRSRATLMRVTIHLVSRADYWPLALAVARRAARRGCAPAPTRRARRRWRARRPRCAGARTAARCGARRSRR